METAECSSVNPRFSTKRQTDAFLSPSHNGATVVTQRDGNQMQSFSLAAMQRRCVGESYSMSAYNQARNSLPQLTDPAPLSSAPVWPGAALGAAWLATKVLKPGHKTHNIEYVCDPMTSKGRT